jgi:hypothetical protein
VEGQGNARGGKRARMHAHQVGVCSAPVNLCSRSVLATCIFSRVPRATRFDARLHRTQRASFRLCFASCHVRVMSVICQCHVRVMSVICQCHVRVMSVICQCHVRVMFVICQCHVRVMSVICQCHVRVMFVSLSGPL